MSRWKEDECPDCWGDGCDSCEFVGSFIEGRKTVTEKIIKDWDELERAAASVGVTMDDVMDAATGLPIRRPVRTPTCPACGAKFQHSSALAACKACGLPDEVLSGGTKAVRSYQKQVGLRVSRGGSFFRRKRAHGRPRGARSR